MKESLKIQTTPEAIFKEYEEGNNFKASIGDLGIFEQTKINERFFVGDQWYGAQCGNNRPLVRNNIIKRIGEYKISSIGSAPIAVNYSADGVPNTNDIKKEGKEVQEQLISKEFNYPTLPDAKEISVICDALSSYQKTTAERVKFDIKNEQMLKNAFISGTGVAYTYWDNDIDTGLYADDRRTCKIKGDIGFEVLDIENVVFGDPNNDDVQSQPYILLAQRLDVRSVRREARRNKLNDTDIVPDGANSYNSGDRGEQEPTDSRRVTVITKLYKEWDEKNNTFKIMAIKVTEKAVVKEAFNVGLSRYPLAVFSWERRRSSIYGDSEITYLIPNQIAINRMLTTECWSALAVGMPKVIVNANIIGEGTKITNDPGQIIKVYPDGENPPASAIQYVAPAPWAAQFQSAVNDLSSNTLSHTGANDAALGNLRPDNAAAIIQMREAALQPMQIFQNRYYAFIEEVARIWADFWVNKYGNRSLKITTRNGEEYIPFNADRYKQLSLTAKVDVGASTLWTESVVISTLDSLLANQLITPVQYLERLPKGIIPKLSELIDDIKGVEETQNEASGVENDIIGKFAEQYPELYSKFAELPPEQQNRMLQQITGGGAQ